jgi:glycogen(starch) synthase
MRILMLGWEFPPFIAGGLGTACNGLTRALDRLGHEVLFVLPREADSNVTEKVRIVGPNTEKKSTQAKTNTSNTSASDESHREPGQVVEGGAIRTAMPAESAQFRNARFLSVPAGRSSPYNDFTPSEPGSLEVLSEGGQHVVITPTGERVLPPGVTPKQFEALAAAGVAPTNESYEGRSGDNYGGDMIGDTARYARFVATIAEQEEFDAIHAHDWMTYAAGVAAAKISGKPLVVHVHSTEFDRSGESVNQQLYELERLGMHAADRIICVSKLTQTICTRRYGVDGSKIEVVYNGIDDDRIQPNPSQNIASTDKIVLFLGRITMQKGPEYFVRAAKRVLEKYTDVKFVVAGAGDMAVRMIEEAAHLGIGHKILFTGFLRGNDVDRVFQMADCYVMPSVSEPFGIAPLEAMKNDVPVIISKQSGVSEVLTHALKVDFWDVDEMANKVIAVLRHPPLSQTLRQHGPMELRGLTWDGAAKRTADVYQAVRDKVLV